MKELLVAIIVIYNAQMLYADTITRSCEKKDLLGTWSVTHIKVLNEKAKESLFHLVMPNQIRIYNEDNSLWTASAKNSLSNYKKLSKFPQGNTYSIKEGTVFTHKNNRLIDKYRCDYFINDLKKANIKKGSISFMWYGDNNKPILANVYEPITKQSSQ